GLDRQRPEAVYRQGLALWQLLRPGNHPLRAHGLHLVDHQPGAGAGKRLLQGRIVRAPFPFPAVQEEELRQGALQRADIGLVARQTIRISPGPPAWLIAGAIHLDVGAKLTVAAHMKVVPLMPGIDRADGRFAIQARRPVDIGRAVAAEGMRAIAATAHIECVDPAYPGPNPVAAVGRIARPEIPRLGTSPNQRPPLHLPPSPPPRAPPR